MLFARQIGSPPVVIAPALFVLWMSDAIARSDGTRASVTRELRAATVEDGLLGDIRFDRYGHLVEGR